MSRNSQQVDRQIPPPRVSVTLTAVPYHQLSYIPYVYRHFDLLVLKIIISTAFYEQKLKIKKNSLMYCHS